MGNLPSVRSNRQPVEPEINILVVGEKEVGKTSLIWRMARTEFWTNLPRPEDTSEMKRRVLLNGKWVKAKFMDSPGYDSPDNVPPNIFRTADAVLVLYDTTNRNVFDVFARWLHVIVGNNEKEATVFLVGTKSDAKPRASNIDEVEAMAKTYGVLVLETSAKRNVGVEEAFTSIMNSLKHLVERKPNLESSVRLHEPPAPPRRNIFSSRGCVHLFSRRSRNERDNASAVHTTASTSSGAPHDAGNSESTPVVPAEQEAASPSNGESTSTSAETKPSEQ